MVISRAEVETMRVLYASHLLGNSSHLCPWDSVSISVKWDDGGLGHMGL